MSLLNEALRKKSRSLSPANKTNLFRTDPGPRRAGKVKTCGFVVLIVVFCALTMLGAWHGFLSASAPSEEQKRNMQFAVRQERVVSKPVRPLKPIKIPAKEKPKEKTVIAGTIERKEKKNENSILEQKEVFKSDGERATKPLKIKALIAKEEKYKEEKKNVQKATEVSSDTSSDRAEDLFYKKAISYHRQNNLEMAVRMYLEVLKKNPEHSDTLLNLSSAYIQSSLFLNAYSLLQKLMSLEPENPQVFLNFAIAEIGLGRPNKGIIYLERAEALIDEPHFEVYLNRGIALSHLDKLDEALTWYKKAEELCAGHPLLLFNVAVACDKLESYDDALRYYAALLKKESGSLTLKDKREVEARIGVLRVYMARQ